MKGNNNEGKTKKEQARDEIVGFAIGFLKDKFPDSFSDNEFETNIRQAIEIGFKKGYNCCSHEVKDAVNSVIDNF